MAESPRVNIHDIARICHEANRAYCQAFGDDSHLPWDQAPDWHKNSILKGVESLLIEGGDNSPESMHQTWFDHKRAEGWVYGPVKDPAKKIHPCMLPWDELPAYQKMKDTLFRAIVKTLVHG